MQMTGPLPPAADDINAVRVILRDGSVAAVRLAQAEDRAAIRAFFTELPPDDRFRRFLSAGVPPDAVIDHGAGALDPAAGRTLLASRLAAGDGARIVAVATYAVSGPRTAEVAFAVAPPFQGHGLATLMLEQLAAHAAARGIERFIATTLAENAAMLDVFRDSGYAVRTTPADGCVEVELALAPTPAGVALAEARHRQATVESIRPILRPRSVAVIGASRDPQTTGSRILAALKRSYTGAVHVVHPDGVSLLGVPAVCSPRDLPPRVDLAVVAVPAASVLAALTDCARAGVRAAVVITAGFAECGAEGRAAQDALVNVVRGSGMRMVGPNCLGVLNLDPGIALNASLSPELPPSGRIALASQNGALGSAIFDLAGERELRLSSFVSLGNKADVSGNDLLEYWEDDEATRVVLLYLESLGNARRFARIARRLSAKKPVVALKAGRTEAGRRAAGSHGAALAASDAVVTALFQQTGVIGAETVDEMFDIAACLDLQPLPAGGRVAIVSNAGGPGILAADACDVAGLSLAAFADATRARLAAVVPAAAGRENPIDMAASAGATAYRATFEAVLADPGVDAVVAIHTPIEAVRPAGIFTAIGDAVGAARAAGAIDKPVLVCAPTRKRRAVPIQAGTERLPAYLFPESAVRALGKVAAYAAWRAASADVT